MKNKIIPLGVALVGFLLFCDIILAKIGDKVMYGLVKLIEYLDEILDRLKHMKLVFMTQRKEEQ